MRLQQSAETTLAVLRHLSGSKVILPLTLAQGVFYHSVHIVTACPESRCSCVCGTKGAVLLEALLGGGYLLAQAVVAKGFGELMLDSDTDRRMNTLALRDPHIMLICRLRARQEMDAR